MLIFLAQLGMMACMVGEMVNDKDIVDFSTNNSYSLIITRFSCTIALHLKCTPEFAKGMKLMNFVNNNPSEFVASRLAFMIGFM